MVTGPVASPPGALRVSSSMPAWLYPTARARRPALLAVAGVVALYTTAAVVAGASDVVLPTVHVWFALGALAGAAAWPHDPAVALLAPLPVGGGRRLVHRVLISTLAAVGAWAIGGEAVDAAVSVTPRVTIADSVPALLALVAMGVAVGSGLGAWGALTPLGVIAAGAMVGGTGPLADALALWWTQPWLVTAAALGVSVLADRGLGPWRARCCRRHRTGVRGTL